MKRTKGWRLITKQAEADDRLSEAWANARARLIAGEPAPPGEWEDLQALTLASEAARQEARDYFNAHPGARVA